jgi:hypothetical protein
MSRLERAISSNRPHLSLRQPPRTSHSPTVGRLGSQTRRRRADRRCSSRSGSARDLWNAFIDWTPGTLRVFDRDSDAALMLPARPAPREEMSQRALREAIDQSPNRFVGIAQVRRVRTLAMAWNLAPVRRAADHIARGGVGGNPACRRVGGDDSEQ